MNKLYHVVKNNISNKDQCNDAIEYEPKFDNKFSLYITTKDTLPLVTFSLQGGKKHRENIIYSLTCLWDSGATERVIKRQHNKPYDSQY